MKAAGAVIVSSGGGSTHCSLPASAMDSEQLQVYKQKTEQMTALIRHYQSELESQKIRRDGVETVSRLLAECRQENVSLKKQRSALQMTVKNLQNRLAVSGLTGAAEVDDNEVIIPGMSKQTLTNLALENVRLRSLLHQENGSEASESLQRTAEDTEPQKSLHGKQTIEQLEAENQSMKRKLSDLEALFKSSNNEKDQQLIHFQAEIQRLSKQKGQATMISDKSATRVSALKDQLKAFMEQCASFESHLENVQEMESELEKKEAAIELVPVSKQTTEQADSIDGVDVKQLVEDKQRLQAKVEEVTEMNQRWQRFFTEKDRHIKSLEQKVVELDTQLKKALHSGTSPDVSQHIQQALHKSQMDMSHLEGLRKKAEDEAGQLRHDLALRDTQVSQLQGQMALLCSAAEQDSEAENTIQLLRAQVQVCTEDFEKERQDRQVALHKVASLQEQNRRLQKLCNHLQTVLNQPERPAVPERRYNEPSPRLQPNIMTFGPSLLAYDGPASPTEDKDSQDYSNLLLESTSRGHNQPEGPGPVSLPATTMELLSRGLEKPRHSLSDSALNADCGKKESFLTCPKCNREFSEEHQGELLAHMDVCCE